MTKPYFRTRSNGVPILSKGEINAIAQSYVQEYQPSALKHPEQFDVEGFLEFNLHMNQDYQYLSHNGIYLGMTVFNETDKLPVYNPNTHRAEYIHVDANTVIIDNSLVEDKRQEHRLRFTGTWRRSFPVYGRRTGSHECPERALWHRADDGSSEQQSGC